MKTLRRSLTVILSMSVAVLIAGCNRTDTPTASEGRSGDVVNLGVGECGSECIQAPDGLVSWWPGDGNANDIVGKSHGILEGGAAFGPGLVNQAFSLDGVDDFVNVPHSEDLNVGTGDFTVDLWVNFDTTEGEQVLIEKYIEVTLGPGPWPELNGWCITKLGNNVISFVGSPAFHNAAFVPPSIPENSWIFVALTRAGNTLTLYWNGEILESVDYAVTDLSCSASLKIGHRGNPQDTPGSTDDRGFYLNGAIDEVEICDRALSAVEIKAVFDAGSAGKCKRVTICHKPGTPAEKTLEIPIQALAGHLKHGDTIGPCE